MKRTTLQSLATLGLLVACSDDVSAPVTAPENPRYLLSGTGPIADAYDGRPVHGAIFTTTPFGTAVNANTKYTRKIEVYLDGGPRNPNALAAGLNDGLYVFQITDPAGKNLLSTDPARCRVVQLSGGVIVGTVPANRIPNLGATTDTWAATGSNRTRACHVESAESDGASLAGQHDTNADTDGGGGTTVQMMPFLDTPNPGGVYKAWITPLKTYVEKSGDIATLNTIPAPANRAQTTGNAPDRGFANPSRQNVKTDNFKVVEHPPFIQIRKLHDADRDGTAANDAELPGWTVTVDEPVDGGTGGGEYLTPTGPIAVSIGSTLTVCEQMQSGWRFSYAIVNGASVQATARTVGTETFYCVDVGPAASSGTVAIAFGNYQPRADARIAITPSHGVNEVEDAHTFTAHVDVDPNESGWVNAPDGTVITFSTTGSGSFFATGTSTPATSCTTAGGTGSCTIDLKNARVGVDVVTAATTAAGVSRSTNGVAPNSAPGTKYWVDAHIAIAPDATNGVGENHVFTATFTAVPGTLPSAVATFNQLAIAITPPAGFASTDYAESTTCATTDPVPSTANVATCTTTINSSRKTPANDPFKANATGTVTIAGTLGTPPASYGDQITRTTDGLGTSAANAYRNSGPARKIYIDGALRWRKVDGLGRPVGGATFEVCRTHDYALATGTSTALASPVCFQPDILDNDSRDVNKTNGEFALTGLRLGTYRVTETIPPAGYIGVTGPQTVSVITATPVTLSDFVNSLLGRMTGGSGKVYLVNLDQYLTSGFTIHCDITLSNNLEINWPGHRWHITKPITSAMCIDDPNVVPDQPDAPFDTFIGTADGVLDGLPGISRVSFTFVDGDGRPGGKANDRVTIVITHPDGVTNALTVTNQPIRGNLQAHEDQPHR